MAKAKLSMLEKMKNQLEEARPKPKVKVKSSKKRMEKKETEVKTVAPVPVPLLQEEKEIPERSHVPRGERADFLKITLTIPADLLTELRALGMRRKANKLKDTDTSALIREAVIDFLNKHKMD